VKPSNIERLIRSFLARMFGTSLRKRKLVIGYDSRNKPQIHEFDIVSDDMGIVGEIKSGRKSRGNYLGALSDCLFLTKVKARKKLLVITDRRFYGYFKVKSEGVIPSNIEIMLIRPEDLVPKIAETT